MTSRSDFEKFLSACRQFLPGTLIALNIADSTRLFDAMGHSALDAAIADIDSKLEKFLAGRGLFIRHGHINCEWLALFNQRSITEIELMTAGLSRTEECLFGWQASALGTKANSAPVKFRETRKVTVTRTVRCVYAHTTMESDLEGLANRLLDSCHGFDPGRPANIDAIPPLPAVAWQSVRGAEDLRIHCPICNGQDFDWIDGDTSTFGGDGTCRNCRSEVSFANAF